MRESKVIFMPWLVFQVHYLFIFGDPWLLLSKCFIYSKGKHQWREHHRWLEPSYSWFLFLFMITIFDIDFNHNSALK